MPPRTRTESYDIADAVSNAFNDAEELKGELESWYDNLPESFQNGSKGEALQEAISAIDGAYQPDVPTEAEGLRCDVVLPTKKKKSRADRMADCVAMIEAAAGAAREKIEKLQAYCYTEDGSGLDPDMHDGGDAEMAPSTEDARDEVVSALESFADELESVQSEWEGVEFPGMYG
jgi:hypothetical protein